MSTEKDNIISSLVINGDTSKLTEQQKVDYYRMFCERVGLDPLSQPFKLLRLNGREVLYCDRTGAQQLNKVHNVSHEIKARETLNGCYVVTTQASLPTGRHTESIGAVPIENLKGDSLCNAMMKAETKSKRRATLDLLGLGMLDESETETLRGAEKMEPPVTTHLPAVVTTEPAAGYPAQPTETVDTMTAYKRKYEIAADIAILVKNATLVKQLAALYHVNQELIEANPQLKDEFTTKKNTLYDNQGIRSAPPPVHSAISPISDEIEIACTQVVETEADAVTIIDNCETANQLKTFYALNKVLIDTHQKAKQHHTTRKVLLSKK